MPGTTGSHLQEALLWCLDSQRRVDLLSFVDLRVWLWHASSEEHKARDWFTLGVESRERLCTFRSSRLGEGSGGSQVMLLLSTASGRPWLTPVGPSFVEATLSIQNYLKTEYYPLYELVRREESETNEKHKTWIWAIVVGRRCMPLAMPLCPWAGCQVAKWGATLHKQTLADSRGGPIWSYLLPWQAGLPHTLGSGDSEACAKVWKRGQAWAQLVVPSLAWRGQQRTREGGNFFWLPGEHQDSGNRSVQFLCQDVARSCPMSSLFLLLFFSKY